MGKLLPSNIRRWDLMENKTIPINGILIREPNNDPSWLVSK